jgi:hypothetical protein
MISYFLLATQRVQTHGPRPTMAIMLGHKDEMI